MQMIMIAGKAQVGKTTLANMIAAEAFNCGMVPVLLSFAGALKKEAADKGYDKETHPDKYREYCQTYGALYRKANPDHWVEKLSDDMERVVKKELSSLKKNKKYWERCIIIDDCRYNNEIAFGIKNDAILIFLSSGKRTLGTDEWRQHESELLADSIENNDANFRDLFHHILFNDKDENSLKKRIKSMVPLWCGLTACKDISKDSCTCAACTARREGRMPSIKEVMADLIDLLDIKEDDWCGDKFLWDDEEDDEETK